MPLSKTNTPYSALPLSNVDPKKARIEAEKGRREELREKFASLRDALPMEGQKASKINILERAISYIGELEGKRNDFIPPKCHPSKLTSKLWRVSGSRTAGKPTVSPQA
ncbi:hypothetical protein QFC22_003095 [Naganishia vaughanmartiniae]|uniref:Uncharacterized protein n=1 Tax=Naganishia vaughanmartiniae TaxID=1424756 RepID=A0ACC2X9X5_9TREE|nr:hypothetical protein QFC22_003095 [Naganishia vaughanmartiniae]